MKKYLPTLLVSSFLLLTPIAILAHCPLCTVGAGAAAAIAVWLGVKIIIIGIFLGAFSLAIGLWIGRMLKKEYIRYQVWVIGLFSFIVTILPLRPMFGDYGSFYLSLAGDYGSLLNRTYLIDRFLVGSILGAVIIILAPFISRSVIKRRGGKIIPYQGVTITFFLLIIVSLVFQFLL